MSNPYTPPNSRVEDTPGLEDESWLRLAGVVLTFSLISLTLSWVLAPVIATLFANWAGLPNTSMLFVDLVLSCAAFFLGSFLAALRSRRRPALAAIAVAGIGWLVYFVEVGGISGILSSAYPIWYELSPSHLGPGVLAALIAKRRRS